ncbi:carbohydrate ABC transporter permease [Paenibacillus koleovorans]|uniref:carbohydrate ABC transporter permease n=1 Tax=Paenibacillus koleovorans TaxID=121608 RepID=UPI0027D76E01|nr:carbohydrate ABC transporter permease [Paenibacillus koleovorans]
MKVQMGFDRAFDVVNIVLMSVVTLLVLYPLYFILISSVSDPVAVNAGKVWIWPQGFTWDGYRQIFKDHTIYLGYRNSLFYTTVGTAFNVVLTISAGYVLSRKDLVGRHFFTFLIVFTMLFHGGLIPTYLVVKTLGMVNTVWALIIPGAVSAFYIIVVRTYFQSSLPDELLEAAQIDGCSNLSFIGRIVIPLSAPIVAVMVLFYAVSHWNAYFGALIYLRNSNLFPLQLVLRQILLANQVQDLAMDTENMTDVLMKSELIKYGVIIVASLPMLVLYPFLQKYLIKGVMLGSIKG